MGGLVTEGTRERIRAASDIVEIIGGYFPLKRAGASFVALCPFHREKSPSFHVNPQRQTFHCFGCNKGGDVFTFVCEYENVSFPEALRRLAERAHIPIEVDEDDGQRQARFLKETLLKIHEEITQRWQGALHNSPGGQIARDYLAKRGVAPEAIELFRLGFAPDAWDDTVNWAKTKGYELDLVEKAGLIIRREGGTGHYDRFRGRLMFPICDEQGRVIGFSGRVLSGDEKTAKYVNSPETPIFTKGRVIYGLDKSKRPLLAAGHAIICEGQLDLIACFTAGVQNVVAPQGTALTADHARILRRYVEEVILCFDSDNAGQNATVRAMDDLLASGLAIRVAAVPSPHDPDSFIREFGAEAFRQVMAGAQGFYDYLLGRLCLQNDLGTDRGRTAVVRAMGQALVKAGNAVLMDTYAQKTALRLGVDPDAIRADFKKGAREAKPLAPAPGPETPAPAPALPPPGGVEYWLLKILLLDDELVEWTAAHLDPEWIEHPHVREVVDHRIRAHWEGRWPGVAAMLSNLEDDALKRLVTEAVAERREIPNRAGQLQDIVLRLRNASYDRQAAQLMRQIGDPLLPESERMALLQQRQRLYKAKQGALQPLGGM
jgi:DNA primase